MKYKYIVSDSYDPYYNLALENCLFDYVNKEEAILFLWQNENTIVVGKNQIIENECKIDEFLASGGTLARRMSGGGAVYHDFGNLNFSLICKSVEKNKVIFHEQVTKTLQEFGIETEFNGRNDILVNGRKFSGNAFYDNGEIYCQHGTLLVKSNIQRMTELLTPSVEKLRRNSVKSIRSRVINLSDINENITVEKIRTALIKTTNAILFETTITKEEIGKKKEFFSDPAWIYGGQR